MDSTSFLIVGIVLGVTYAILGVCAYFHVDETKIEPMAPRILAVSFWWPFYDLYDDAGRKLCVYGRIIFPFAIAAYVLYWVG